MNNFFTRLFAAALVFSMVGCVSQTIPKRGTAHIAITPSGQARVENQIIPLSKLGKKLKSMGATGETSIMISVPQNVSQATLVEATKSLASAGLQKIAFTKPVEKTVSTNVETKPKTQPYKPKSVKIRTPARTPVRSGTL